MTYVSTVIADGAGGLWELGESTVSNGSTATDATGNQNGVYNSSGTGFTGSVTGIPGGGGVTAVALATSANTNKVTAAAVTANNCADSAMTLECWVKRSATQGATQRIMGTTSATGAQLGWNSSNQLQVGKISVGNICASTVAVTDTTTFHHLVWTKAGSTNHVYVDGTDVSGSVTNQTLSTSSGWSIFTDNSANNSPPIGMTMTMVAVYKSVLTPTQVATHYSLGSSSGAIAAHTSGFRFRF